MTTTHAERLAGITEEVNYFAELNKIDVSKYVEKKGKFSYLSWTYAIQTLKKHHPDATWDIERDEKGQPFFKTEFGVFVEVSVTVNGITHSQIHPVLDNNNRPIEKPNAFQINTSIQRCLVKAIALHGLGLYIYAGEDLPELDEGPATSDSAPATKAAATPAVPNARDAARAKAAAKLAEKQAAEAAAAATRVDDLPTGNPAASTPPHGQDSVIKTPAETSEVVEPINAGQIKAIGNMLTLLKRKQPTLNEEEFLSTVFAQYGKTQVEELTFDEAREAVMTINAEMRK